MTDRRGFCGMMAAIVVAVLAVFGIGNPAEAANLKVRPEVARDVCKCALCGQAIDWNKTEGDWVNAHFAVNATGMLQVVHRGECEQRLQMRTHLEREFAAAGVNHPRSEAKHWEKITWRNGNAHLYADPSRLIVRNFDYKTTQADVGRYVITTGWPMPSAT